MDQIRELLREVGEWTGDASVGRGAVTVAGGTMAVLFAFYRWLRGKPKARTIIHIDCEPGENITVRTGEETAAEAEQKKEFRV